MAAYFFSRSILDTFGFFIRESLGTVTGGRCSDSFADSFFVFLGVYTSCLLTFLRDGSV